jgi:hypothetical protein
MKTNLRVSLTLAFSFIVIALAAACDGADGVTGPAPDVVAMHFDSLYLEALHSQAFGELGHAAQLTILEAGVAFGGRQTDIAMRTKNGVEQWNGVEYLINRDSANADYTFMAYRDADAHTLLYLHFRKNGSLVDARLTTSDSIYFDGSGTGTTGTSVIGGKSCSTFSPTLQNGALAGFQSEACSIVRFHSSASLDFGSVPRIDAVLGHLEFMATFTGEQFAGP